MDDIRFMLEFAQRGNLEKMIKDVERLNEALDKNTAIQKQNKDVVSQLTQQQQQHAKAVEETQRKVQASDSSKQFIALTAEVHKLRKEYEQLTADINKVTEAKRKQKELTDQQLQQQLREQANANKRKAQIREQIKDEQALTYSINTQTRSIQELQAKNNALIRQRKMVDMTTKEGKQRYDELTMAIRKNNAELKAHDAAIGSHVRNVGNYGSALKGVGSGLMQIAGITGGIGIIMGIGNAAAEASQKFVAFDKSLKELSAITGLTGQDLAFFEQQAMMIGTTTRVSAQQYLEAIKLMGSAKPELLNNKEALAEVTNQAIILSDATGMELPVAIEKLGGFLNAMNLPASEAARVVNTLAAASQKGAKEVPFVAEALSKFGGVAAAAGISVEQSAAAIELLGAKIPQAETVGTGLRNVILELQTAAAAQGREFQGLSKELELLAPRVNDITFLEKQFGKENILVAQTLINQRNELDQLTVAITGTNTAVEQAAINNDSWAARSERAANRVEVAYIKLGKSITPGIARWNEFKASVIEGTADLLSLPSQLAQGFENINTLFGKLTKNGDAFAAGAERLRQAVAEGRLTVDEFASSMQYLSGIQDQFNNFTAEGQRLAKMYFDEYKNGTITMDQFFQKIKQIQYGEARDRKNQEILNSLTGDRIAKGNELKKQYDQKVIDEHEYRASLIALMKEEEASVKIQEKRADAIGKVTTKTKQLKKEEDAVREARFAEKEVTDKERMDRELADLEGMYKRRKTALVENIEDEETLRNHQYDLDLMRAEERIRILEKYDMDSTDARLELAELEARRRKEISDEIVSNEKAAQDKITADREKAAREEEERLRRQEQFIRNTTQYAIDEARRAVEEQIRIREEAVDNQEENVERQRRLAEQGLENTLAFEKQLQAERERELLEAQRKAERLKKIETFYNLFSSYANEDPSTAAAKALVQLGIGEAIAATFEDGGVVSDVVAQQNGGVLRGPRHSGGGILIEAEGDEGIFSRKEMRRLGKDKFYQLKDALNKGGLEDFIRMNNDVAGVLMQPQQIVDLKPLEREMQSVKKAIEDKPVPAFTLDRYGNLITNTKGNGQNRYHIQRKGGFNA